MLRVEGIWTVWSYRGAAVHSCDVTNLLLMPNHPLDGKLHQDREMLFRVIDRWLDHHGLPLHLLLLLPLPPQVIPAGTRAGFCLEPSKSISIVPPFRVEVVSTAGPSGLQTPGGPSF
jgi:hypothetical protein